MTEKSTNGLSAQNEKKQGQPQVNVLGQYIKDLSFENPNAPDILKGQIKNPNIKLNFNVIVKQIETEIYEVALGIEGNATSDEGLLYNIELVYAGAFRLKDLPREAVQPFLYIECPALLFPFVRRLLADLTREGGFPPLLLDPINFAELYRQNRAKEKAATAES
jgi:preprotein translocase subunit SecB